MRTVLLGTLAAMVGATDALALDVVSAKSATVDITANCRLVAFAVNTPADPYKGYVYLVLNGDTSFAARQYAGGYIFNSTANPQSRTSQALTLSDLQQCTGLTNINIIRNDGASGTWSTDDYLGINFTADKDGQPMEFNAFISGVTGSLLNAYSGDAAAPTVTLSSPARFSPQQPLTVSIDFNEIVYGFSSSSISVTNGTLWSFSGSGKNYTVTIVGGSAGAVTVDVAAAAAQDASGNGNTASNTLNAVYDDVAPVITAVNSMTATSDPTSGVASVAFATSVSDDSGETPLPVFKIGATVITSPYDFPIGDTLVTIDARDSAGNPAAQEAFLVTVNDATPPPAPPAPTIAQNGDGTLTVSGTTEPNATVTVTFPDGTTKTVTADGSGNYTATSDDRQTNGDVTVVATDASGNASAPTTVTFTDTTPPAAPLINSVAQNGDGTLTVSGTAEPGSTVRIVYPDGSTFDAIADGSGAWSATSPLAQTSGSVSATARDAANNTSAQTTTTFSDTTAPGAPVAPTVTVDNNGVVTINGRTEPNATVTITMPDGSTVSVIADGNGDYSATGGPYNGTTLTIVVTDVAGNDSPPLTFSYNDTTPPTLSITAPIMTDNIINAAEAAATTIAGSAAGAEDGQIVTLVIAAQGGGQVTTTAPVVSGVWSATADLSALPNGALTIAADVTDRAGNAAPSAQASATLARTPPILTISAETPDANGAFWASVSFAAPVTGFTISDLVIANGAASSFTATSASVYRFFVTPTGAGPVTIVIAAGAATDANGNPTGASSLNIVRDNVRPGVTLSAPAGLARDTVTVAVAFTEDVTGFTASDVVITNGVVTALTGAGADYELTVAVSYTGAIEIDIPENAASDAAANGNLAAQTLVIDTVSPASEFDANRAEIRAIARNSAASSLRSQRATLQSLVRGARQRMAHPIGEEEKTASNTPQRFASNDTGASANGDGRIVYSDGVLTGNGAFNASRALGPAGGRAVFQGAFDIIFDGEGSRQVNVNMTAGWEYQPANSLLLGYFVGGRFSDATIAGDFAGDDTSRGFNLGAYFVHEPRRNLYIDGYVSGAFDFAKVDIANETLTLRSDYKRKYVNGGLAISGVIERTRSEIWPTLEIAYGRAFVGGMRFRGQAFGMTDDNLLLDAGSLGALELALSPEFRYSITGDPMDRSTLVISVAPRLACTVADDVYGAACGGGARTELAGIFSDGAARLNLSAEYDRLNALNRVGVRLIFRRAF